MLNTLLTILESETVLHSMIDGMIDALPGSGEAPISMRQWVIRLNEGDYSPWAEKLLRDRYARFREKGLLEGLVNVTEITTKGGPRYFFSRIEQPVTAELPTLSVSSLAKIALSKPRPARVFTVRLVHVGDIFRGIRP